MDPVEISAGGYLVHGESATEGQDMAHDDYESTVEHAEERPKLKQVPPPGPADHGGQGGMTTRENAPQLAGGDEPPD